MPARRSNSRKIGLARSLRRTQNPAETVLWSRLRNLQVEGAKFRRQHPIGKYIVDFVDLNKKLVIEIDGGPHDLDKIKKMDEARTTWLVSEGYRVLRFWSSEVLTNLEGVCFLIREALK